MLNAWIILFSFFKKMTLLKKPCYGKKIDFLFQDLYRIGDYDSDEGEIWDEDEADEWEEDGEFLR